MQRIISMWSLTAWLLAAWSLAAWSLTAATGSLAASMISPRGGKIVLQAAQPAAVVTHTGCLLGKDGRFLQQDEETQQVFEIRGPDLKANIGNRVLTTGRVAAARPAIPLATAVIDVMTVSPRSQGGCLSVASSLEAQANP